MVAEAQVKLVERFGTGQPGEIPKTAEFLDEIERRARSDKRARQRHLRETAAKATGDEELDAPLTEAVPIELRDWSNPVDVADIDWSSSAYDIVTVKEIRP